jgi:hypothetical protein
MMRTIVFVSTVLLGSATLATAQQLPVDHHLASRPENLAWGAFPKDKPPVLRVASGQTVRIDTLSHAGSTQDEHPVAYLGK